MQQQTLTDRQAEYAAYRQTPAWLERRRLALEAAAHRCQVCNATGRLDVHHRTYERIFNELPGDLTVLCRDCHATFHGKQGAAALSKPKPARPKGKRKKSKGHARPKQRNKAWHWQIPTFLTTVPGASTADVALRFSVDPGQASDRLIALSALDRPKVTRIGHGWHALDPDGSPILAEPLKPSRPKRTRW